MFGDKKYKLCNSLFFAKTVCLNHPTVQKVTLQQMKKEQIVRK